ncbi:hypothetical protein [Nocardioides jejuensis]|uniref:Uncharacterized protein n=1 Tax=Nocardioides jejuensis TaxID=2502782 RepID=A0A4R1C075_9ACTN|nr:hypothetical protein [Nocardioides jejuensis]TCJ23045.1 hypothetical protein EPD65_11830 [Nocardioides jejuensis]
MTTTNAATRHALAIPTIVVVAQSAGLPEPTGYIADGDTVTLDLPTRAALDAWAAWLGAEVETTMSLGSINYREASGTKLHVPMTLRHVGADLVAVTQ